MNCVRLKFLPFILLLLSCRPAAARLGETEAQSESRYGPPAPELAAPTDKPLLEGAREVIYNYQGWRVRAAFLNQATVRIEYVHLPKNGAPKPLTEEEVKAILEAEKSTYSWREEKPRTGSKEINALKTALEGRRWERSDHALAALKFNLVLVLETREAGAAEKKGGRPAKGSPAPGPNVPKF